MGDEANPSIPPTHPAVEPSDGNAPETSAAEPRVFICPACAGSVEVSPHTGETFIDCPYCHEQFALPSTEEGDERTDDDVDEDPESELDGMRIRQLSTLRRAAVRARTYLQIGWVVCGVGGVQLTLKAVQRVRFEHVWDLRTIAFGAFSIASFMVSIYFFKRSREISWELNKPLLDEPTTPPDFSTLSDGSQHARDLEDIR